jgi:glycosyltransferase involved in cell wall biosynthesis
MAVSSRSSHRNHRVQRDPTIVPPSFESRRTHPDGVRSTGRSHEESSLPLSIESVECHIVSSGWGLRVVFNTAQCEWRSMSTPYIMFVVTEDYYFVSHRLNLAAAALEAGYRVAVVTRVQAHRQVVEDAGIRCLEFDIARSGVNPMRDVLSMLRLVTLYRRERPDIVHHVAMKPVLYGSVAALLAGRIGVVNALAGMGWLFTSRDARVRGVRTFVRWCFRWLLRTGLVIVQNPDDEILLVGMGVPGTRIRRIAGSGVDLVRFSASPEPEGIPVVLLPARLLWDKGVGEFVAASRLLKQRGVAARFVLAGEPDPHNPAAVSECQLREWVQEGVVEYVGWCDDMPDLLRKSHLVCLPSYREGLPKSLIEAAAAGRPIVTTDVPGCREAVLDGSTGILVTARNPFDLADALEELVLNRERRVDMGARGRALAEERFGLSAINAQTLSIYSQLLSGSICGPHYGCEQPSLKGRGSAS